MPFPDDIDYLLVSASVRDDPDGGEVIRRLRGREFEVAFESEGIVLLTRWRDAGV